MTMPRVGKDLLGSIRLNGAPQEGGCVVLADLMKLVPEIYRGAKSGADPVSTMVGYLGARASRSATFTSLKRALPPSARSRIPATF
jgi:hypothetical protein